jgi:hypothetical protein
MKLISHRGNVNGPQPHKENRPSYIDCAIRQGYDVEIDVTFLEGNFWLGHDTPDYKIELSWMLPRKDNLWFHCKDLLSCIKLLESHVDFKSFCHRADPYVLTTTGHIWVHEFSDVINDKCIIPLLTREELLSQHKQFKPYAICTDFPSLLK